jgi:hypothetical protein
VRGCVLLCLLAGCAFEPIDETDEVFYDWDQRRVFCAVGLDPVSGNELASVMDGLERAADRGEVLQLFGHAPGSHIPYDRLEAVLDRAVELGLDFVTARDLAAGGPPRAGLALSIDDSDVDAWFEARELFAARAARVSFYVTRFDRLSSARRDKLRQLVADGHTVEAHGLDHIIAPEYVEEHGLAAYLVDEALPSIELLRAEGFDPIAYAYPHGARTSEIDEALLDHVEIVRSVTFTIPYPLVTDPCPE